MAVAVLSDLAAVRAQLPATNAVTYLNTAMCSPLPVVTATEMINDIGVDRDSGRVSMGGYDLTVQRMADLRGRLAGILGAAPGDIALTSSTSAGIDVVVSGHDWQPGDRIVTTNLEHPAALAPLYRVHQRYGVEIVFADVGNGEPDRALDAVAAAVDHPATKLLMVSHVTYGTGALLPLDKIVRVAHDAGVEVLADGAQSVGAVPVDVTASGADYLAFPGRKWLFGPDGTGALYVNPARLGDLHPREPHLAAIDAGIDTIRNADISHIAVTAHNTDTSRIADAGPARLPADDTRSDADTFADTFADIDASRYVDASHQAAPHKAVVFPSDQFRGADVDPIRLPPGAVRFDRHCGARPLAVGLSASLDWLGSLGWPALHSTIAARTEYARARAVELPGSCVLTPAGSNVGIVAFTIDGVDPVACVEFLARNTVVVRSIPDNGAIRVSCGFFTTVDEIDRAFSLIDAFRRRS